jgi:hypothetical protein
MKKTFLGIGLIALMLLGCTAKYMPIQSKDVILSEFFGIVNNDDYQFAAENRYWSYEPDEFAEYFIAFYVVIKNRSDDKLQINSTDFALIDQNGDQFDALDNESLERLIEPNRLELLNDLHNSGSHFFDQNDDDILNEQQTSLEKWQKARENLIRYVFRYGALRPGARKSGFVFFPKISERNKNCKIIFKDSSIEFSKIKDKIVK